MAGDWIKMRVDVADDPAVIGLSAGLDLSEDAVVGKLHRLWSWADRHTVDGSAPGITAKWVDRYISCPGFAEIMVRFGWLAFSDFGITFPNFERHNGATAKKRAENTSRQRLSREERDNHVTGEKRDIIPRPFVRHIFERDGYQCVYCGESSTPQREDSRKGRLSIDHLIPISRGGSTVVCNLVCCCRLCNNEKNDRTPEEWGFEPSYFQEGVSYGGGIVTDARQERDKSATREEKRREEKEDKTPLPPSSPKKKLPKKTADRQYSPEFLRFWEIFPSVRKGKKPEAWSAWQSAILRAPPDSIIAAAEEFSKSELATSEFCPGPAPWLNKDRWDDDREAWKRRDGQNGKHDPRYNLIDASNYQ